MLKVKVNNKEEYSVAFEDLKFLKGRLNSEPFEWDVIDIKKDSFHVIKGHQSYNVEVIKADYHSKSFTIRVNGNDYHLLVKDKFDDLLVSLGFDAMNAKKVSEIRAPMPGLVLDLRVAEGVAVKKGDPLVVLEAMKMENILKSPADGLIKKINVKKGQAVEKNQILINFA